MKLRSLLLLGAVLCGARPTWSDSTAPAAFSHEVATTDICMNPTGSSDLLSANFSEPSSGRCDSFSFYAGQQLEKERERDNLPIAPTPEAASVPLRLTEPTCLTVLGSGMLALGTLGFRRRRAAPSAATVDTETYVGGSLDQTARIARLSRSATAIQLE
jgi:hypothetical protein